MHVRTQLSPLPDEQRHIAASVDYDDRGRPIIVLSDEYGDAIDKPEIRAALTTAADKALISGCAWIVAQSGDRIHIATPKGGEALDRALDRIGSALMLARISDANLLKACDGISKCATFLYVLRRADRTDDSLFADYRLADIEHWYAVADVTGTLAEAEAA